LRGPTLAFDPSSVELALFLAFLELESWFCGFDISRYGYGDGICHSYAVKPEDESGD
jgi:hypothetical protein